MFVSKNEPDKFSWHDAEIKSVSYDNENMIWKVDALNVLSSNSQNSNEFDCCISTAYVVFAKYSIESIKHYGFQKYQDGKLIEEQPDSELSTEDISKLLDEVAGDTNEMHIRYINAVESYADEQGLHISCDVDLMSGEESNVCFEILCDELTVKWDEFLGKPWYCLRTDKLQ